MRTADPLTLGMDPPQNAGRAVLTRHGDLLQPSEKHMSIRFAALALVLLSAATLAQANPKVTKKVPPEYPAEAVRKNISSGSVRAKLTIAADGKVTNVEIVDANPKRVFDKATVAALMEWRFDTGGKDETYEIKLVFRNDE